MDIFFVKVWVDEATNNRLKSKRRAISQMAQLALISELNCYPAQVKVVWVPFDSRGAVNMGNLVVEVETPPLIKYQLESLRNRMLEKLDLELRVLDNNYSVVIREAPTAWGGHLIPD